MARVVAFIPDLLFGSKVQAAIAQAGHDPVLAGDPAGLGAALNGADGLVVDLTADAAARIDAVTSARPDGLPVLGFFSHVESAVRDQALGAGFDRVVPRSRMAREGATLVAALVQGAPGPVIE